jgi:luciferase family oxidoreductase group 1
MIRLSVLDQSVAIRGRRHRDSISETVELAELCEGLGYHRFWVSEHHSHDTIVGTAPEILMAAIATRTRSIRVGSAGVMLPHYSAFKVAEQFRVLEALAPGRIDLGVGRAPGSDSRTAQALNPFGTMRTLQFPEQVRDLIAWVSGEDLPEVHPFRQVRAYPAGDTAPVVWMLGSSDYGAQVAAHFGLPYSFAYFITDGVGVEQALSLYRQLYRPSPRHPEPVANICVWALVAETEAEAQRLFTSRAHWRVARDRGLLAPIDAPETSLPFEPTPLEEARIAEMRRTAFVGTPADVGRRLRTLADELGLEEIVILTWSHDPAARRRSYELLAREFELKAR